MIRYHTVVLSAEVVDACIDFAPGYAPLDVATLQQRLIAAKVSLWELGNGIVAPEMQARLSTPVAVTAAEVAHLKSAVEARVCTLATQLGITEKEECAAVTRASYELELPTSTNHRVMVLSERECTVLRGLAAAFRLMPSVHWARDDDAELAMRRASGRAGAASRMLREWATQPSHTAATIPLPISCFERETVLQTAHSLLGGTIDDVQFSVLVGGPPAALRTLQEKLVNAQGPQCARGARAEPPVQSGAECNPPSRSDDSRP